MQTLASLCGEISLTLNPIWNTAATTSPTA